MDGMSVDQQHSGLDLANRASSAIAGGDLAAGAGLAEAAAAAFLAEQGEPNFDAPNMLRVRTEALLTLGDHAGAARTLDRADAFAAKLPAGEPFDNLRVQLGRLRGAALLDGGDRPGARAVLTRTLELCGATVGADGADAAALHNMLGIVGKFTGTFDAAAEHYARALEIYERLQAAPAIIATLHHNLGGLAHSRGDLETAERETRRALEMRTASHGPAHPDTAADRGQLGGILSELGRHEEAERELRRTAQDFAAAFGPDHFEVAIAHTSLGAALHRVGRLDEADAAYRQGLSARERTQGAEHPMLAPTLLNLSALCEERGDRDAARAFAVRAAAVLDGAVTADHPHRLAAHERLAALDVAAS
jgi:tetratricopeptide (TPR) repeat protein